MTEVTLAWFLYYEAVNGDRRSQTWVTMSTIPGIGRRAHRIRQRRSGDDAARSRRRSFRVERSPVRHQASACAARARFTRDPPCDFAGAEKTLRLEAGTEPSELYPLADQVHEPDEMAASVSSGSFLTAGMVVCPCSMRTLAAIATGKLIRC